jgi:glycosyltransferase involved in cell wall biosynthesis
MKHVWILNHYGQEPGSSGGTRHYSLARHLGDFGWKATIIAASTVHPSGNQRLQPGKNFQFNSIEGVDFLWLRACPYSGNGLDRVFNMIEYGWRCLTSTAVTTLDAPDIIIGSSVHPLAAWAGSRLARRYQVPFIFEVRDLWPETLIAMGKLNRNSPSAVALRWVERNLYRKADQIITLLPYASEYIVPLGIDEEKITWISNGVELASNSPPPPSQNLSEFVLMYFGSHGNANALATLIRAMKIVDESTSDSILLRLIGDGPLKGGLIELTADLNLKNVKFEPPVPRNMIPSLASQADAFVISTLDLPELYKFGVSMNKLFDYMAAARPILFAAHAGNNPVADAGAGISVAPGEPKQIADAILKLARMPRVERKAMGEAGYEHAYANYSYKKLSAKLATTLSRIVDQKNEE